MLLDSPLTLRCAPLFPAFRLVNPQSDCGALLGTWLEAAAGRGGEVVLVQEHNSFFAYEPVLRALQVGGGP